MVNGWSVSVFKVVQALSFALAALGAAYLASKSIFLSELAVDFPYIWLAGELWSADIDPYSDAFRSAGREFFSHQHAPEIWFYPPSWWGISTFLALLDYDTALWVWRTGGAVMLCVGLVTVERGMQAIGKPPGRIAMLLAFAWACLFSGTATSLSLGQTSLLSFLGLCLYLASVLTVNRPILIAALVLLMLKPQIGLPFCAFLLPWRRYWLSLVVAALISVVLALPALQLSGLGPFLSTYLVQLGEHALLEPNHPRETTGVRILAWNLSGLIIEPLVLTGIAAVFGLALGFFAAARDHAMERYLALLVAVSALILQLHIYDLMMLALVILLCTGVLSWSRGLMAAGFVMLVRANNLAEVTGLYDPATKFFTGSLIGTIGIVLLTAGVASWFFKASPDTTSLVDPG